MHQKILDICFLLTYLSDALLSGFPAHSTNLLGGLYGIQLNGDEQLCLELFYGQRKPAFRAGADVPISKVVWTAHHTDIWDGDINIVDLGETKLKAYTNPKIPWTELHWGGVVRYRGLDAYFRYEGGGQITIVIDQVGSITVHFDQGGMMVNLADMQVS